MDDKKLHKLNKTELLWIIRDQEAEIEELREYVRLLGGDPGFIQNGELPEVKKDNI